MASKPVSKSKKQDPDFALVEDIRLLGRILGDVIREQEGVEVFNLIEQIRTLSVRFHRHGDDQANHAHGKEAAHTGQVALRCIAVQA